MKNIITNPKTWPILGLVIAMSITSCNKEADPEPSNSLPFEVKTSATVDQIKGTQAKLYGEVTGDGGNTVIERGFCGGTSSTNLKLKSDNKAASGSGVGTFENLSKTYVPSTQFYIRAYAINDKKDTIYGNIVSFSTTALELGEFYKGGYVFYVDPNSPANDPSGICAGGSDIVASSAWGISGTSVSTSYNIGTGQANTTTIVNAGAGSGTAAYECDNYSSGGFTDWYLPSANEMVLMNANLYLNGKGGFSTGDYWTSTQPTNGVGASQPNSLGTTMTFSSNSGTLSAYLRSNNYPKVRPVRSF